LYDRAISIRRFQLGESSLSVADLLSDIGNVKYRLNRLEDAKAMFREAIRIKELKLGRNNVEVAQDMGRLGLVVCDLDRLPVGEALLKEALHIRNSIMGDHPVFGRESKEEAESLTHLEDMAALQNRTDEAESLYLEAMRIQERLGADAALVAHLRNRIAELQPPPLADI
jgi:tetratricopeptide (TPR) repeat protein